MRDPQLLQLLGPDMKVAPQVVQQTKEQVQNYTLEHLLLRLNQEEDVPAYFILALSNLFHSFCSIILMEVTSR